MSEKKLEQPTSPDQLSDILLVLDKEKKKIQAVKGVGKNGELETVDPVKKNNGEFMKVDKHGDVFSNFFSNFLRQLKNPTRFSFFKMPAPIAVDTAEKMQKHIDVPTKEGKELLTKYEIKAESPKESQPQKNAEKDNKNNMETTETKSQKDEYRYKPEQIDWETMNNLGLSKERLEKLGVLDPLLKGFKTNELVPISLNLDSAIIRSDARLSLQPGSDGKAIVALHCVRKEPELNKPFFGHEFSKEDKENLQRTGNMGRVVDLTNPKTDEIIPSIVSVDRLTNELVAFRADRMKVPDEMNGVKLDEQQKQDILAGKEVHMKGMISKKGKSFDSPIQYSADKGFIEFLFDRKHAQNRTQSQQVRQQGQPPYEAPRTFRGKELTDQQYEKYNAGITIYVDGLIDKKGEKYQGYATFNKETGKEQFSFTNPNKLKEKIQPAEANKTQVAVNSEGKTNEATRKIKEPLAPGQKEPKNKMQQQQQDSPKPAKSKGIKR